MIPTYTSLWSDVSVHSGRVVRVCVLDGVTSAYVLGVIPTYALLWSEASVHSVRMIQACILCGVLSACILRVISIYTLLWSDIGVQSTRVIRACILCGVISACILRVIPKKVSHTKALATCHVRIYRSYARSCTCLEWKPTKTKNHLLHVDILVCL